VYLPQALPHSRDQLLQKGNYQLKASKHPKNIAKAKNEGKFGTRNLH
jgi:hypothetical protein